MCDPKRNGFTLIEMLIVVTIMLIIATVTIPRLDAAKNLAEETAAIRNIQAIHVAQAQHFSQAGRYAARLEELGATGMLLGDLAKGAKGGYLFTMQAAPGGYSIHAVPRQFGATGGRTFFSDQTMVIRENRGPEPAALNSPEIK